ncbi:MAG: hypothetical protein MdMp014T_0092 [Treponematales bacterium]
MTIQQTVQIPASRRLSFKVPAEVPAGKATITVNITAVPAPKPPKPPKTAKPAKRGKPPAPLTEAEMEAGVECPVCKHYGYTPNAKTIAAIEETRAMSRGEIPAIRFSSFEEFLRDLKS